MSDLFEDTNAPEVKFEDLVGEGKKFKDPDAVAKKVLHADQHITNLEKEMADLRADLQARLTLEEMMEKLPKGTPVTPTTPPTREMPGTDRQENGSQLNLSEEVQKLLKAEKEKDRRETNLFTVRNELKNRFGPDYNNRLTEIAEQLDVSKEFLTGMAQTSPSGFLKLVDSVAKPDNRRPMTPPASGLDTARNLNPGTAKTAAFYRELRRTDPGTYHSRKVQKEIHDEAMRQGSDFYK